MAGVLQHASAGEAEVCLGITYTELSRTQGSSRVH